MDDVTPLRAGVLLSVAYDGRAFHGFAMQPDQRTVAGELLGALQAIDPTVRQIRGASRTDAGVHAKDQRVAFDASRAFPPTAWTHGAQKHLPETISIRAAWAVDEGFSPRATSVEKTYRYLLLVDPTRDPFLVGRVWRVPELARPGALDRMKDEALAAIGTLDFAAFRGALDRRESTVRTLSHVGVSWVGADSGPTRGESGRLLAVDVTGDGFLYNMVRILVGTIVDVGRGRRDPGAVSRALTSKDRTHAGITAPPDGLYLERYRLEGDETRPFTDPRL